MQSVLARVPFCLCCHSAKNRNTAQKRRIYGIFEGMKLDQSRRGFVGRGVVQSAIVYRPFVIACTQVGYCALHFCKIIRGRRALYVRKRRAVRRCMRSEIRVRVMKAVHAQRHDRRNAYRFSIIIQCVYKCALASARRRGQQRDYRLARLCMKFA